MSELSKVPATGKAALLGSSIAIKGEVFSSEDLIVEGEVEGRIELKSHNLTIGTQGRVKAQVHARNVIAEGTVTGDILAEEKISILETAVVSGDLRAPRIAIADGAQFRGSVDMTKPGEARPGPKLAQEQPVTQPAAALAGER
jgi:cytoskeletal protein CcmA (bactofilin family)